MGSDRERSTVPHRLSFQASTWSPSRRGASALNSASFASLFDTYVPIRHILALDTEGALWTWGSGRDGRLGHDDYVHRFAPKRVDFFHTESLRVTMVAAGDAHSLAVAVPRDWRPPALGEVDYEPVTEQVYTWGRGAHGRLGLSRNLNKRRPTPVMCAFGYTRAFILTLWSVRRWLPGRPVSVAVASVALRLAAHTRLCLLRSLSLLVW